MPMTEIIATAIAGLSFILSLVLGIASMVRARRADKTAKRAEERADRIEARTLERHDADWQFRFQPGDSTVLEIFNAGADDAHNVLVVADVDGVREYVEREIVRGTEATVVEIAFPFLREELERVSIEDQRLRARTRGLGSVTLTVTVNVRVTWTTALGTPRSIDSGPRELELT